MAASAASSRVRAHAPLAVDGDPYELTRADAEHPERADRRHVHLVADDDRQARRALQAVALDVPAGAAQHLVASGRQARDVGHVAAGHEAHAGRGREPEQFEQPAADDVFEHRHSRRHHVEGAVLIPRRGEPLGGHRDRHGTTGDEAEVAGAGGGDEPRIHGPSERRDDVCGLLSTRRQGTAEGRLQFGARRPGAHVTGAGAVEIGDGPHRGRQQQFAIRHVANRSAARPGDTWGPVTPFISILVPVFNEATTVAAVIARLLEVPLPAPRRTPAIVLESWEHEAFRARFSGQTYGALDWPPRYDLDRRVQIFLPEDRARYRAGETVATERVFEARPARGR